MFLIFNSNEKKVKSKLLVDTHGAMCIKNNGVTYILITLTYICDFFLIVVEFSELGRKRVRCQKDFNRCSFGMNAAITTHLPLNTQGQKKLKHKKKLKLKKMLHWQTNAV